MKTLKISHFTIFGVLFLMLTTGCKKDEISLLSVDKEEIVLSDKNSSAALKITTEGDWYITAPGIEPGYGAIFFIDWYEADKTFGANVATVTFSIKEDAVTAGNKTDTLTIIGENNNVTVLLKFNKE